MKKIYAISLLIFAGISTGCGSKTAMKPREKESVLLTVDFEQGKTLRYEFVSEREVDIQWDTSGSSGGEVPNASREKLDLIMAYTPVSVDPYGLTTVKADCQAAKVRRYGGTQTSLRRADITQKDAAEYFMGKSFTFTVDPTGKIHDYSQLEELIKQVSEKAFSSGTGENKIKQPDMISDFIATQWFLWNSISSIQNPSHGVTPGESWTSKLPVPTPMVSRLARDVNYTLDEIRPSENGSIAVISSIYSKSDSVPQNWPVPYTGSFQMRGTFGLLGNYKLLDLTGKGSELFNIDKGQIEVQNQQYDLDIKASMPLGLGVEPVINIKQTISMKLIKE